MRFADVVCIADVVGGAFAACAALLDTSVADADFALSTVEVGAASGGAGFFGGIAELALSAGGVGGAARFASSGIAVLASAARSIGGAASRFALAIFADGIGTAVGIATATFDAFGRSADLASAALIVASTFGGGTFVGSAGLTTGAVIGGLAAGDALAGGADLTELAFLIAGARRSANLASTIDTLLVCGAVGIAAATGGALGSCGFADGACFAVGVGTADIGFATTGDADRTSSAVVVGFATLAALILAANLTALAFRIRTAAFFAGSRKAEGSIGAVGVGFAAGGRGGGSAGGANAVTTLAFVTKVGLAVFNDATRRAADAIDATLVALALGVAATFGVLIGVFRRTSEILTGIAVRTVPRTATGVGSRRDGSTRAVVRIPADVAVRMRILTKTSGEPSHRKSKKGQDQIGRAHV